MPELIDEELYGDVSAYGLEKETGIMVEAVNFDATATEIEQLDSQGNLCGVRVRFNGKQTGSLTGAIPLTGASDYKIGAAIVMANEVPQVWRKAPSNLSVAITGIKRTLSNSAAQKLDLTLAVYPFAKTAAPSMIDVLDN